jgi:hypothetical protein
MTIASGWLWLLSVSVATAPPGKGDGPPLLEWASRIARGVGPRTPPTSTTGDL